MRGVGEVMSIGKNYKEAFQKAIRSLENGRQVKLSGFGNFDLREKKQRPGRNPKTGEPMALPAHNTLVFRPSRLLLRALNDAARAVHLLGLAIGFGVAIVADMSAARLFIRPLDPREIVMKVGEVSSATAPTPVPAELL